MFQNYGSAFGSFVLHGFAAGASGGGMRLSFNSALSAADSITDEAVDFLGGTPKRAAGMVVPAGTGLNDIN